MKAIIKQAMKEIAKENKLEKLVEAKNIIRQIEILEKQLADLRKQITNI